MEKRSLDLISAKTFLPERDINGHKGSFGKVLLICGSRNMVGCCVLVAKGALRSGAGIVTVAFPDVLYNALTSQLTEALFLSLESDEKGFISQAAIGDIIEEANKADVVLVGCGIGIGCAQKLIVSSLINMENKSVIIDADGLNNLTDCVNILKEAKADILLTPHPGEMARLMKSSVEEIEKDREKTVHNFVSEYGINVLLKGHETLICNKDYSEVYINKTGNTGLSKGGSGDLLAGIIAGLTGSVKCGVFKAAVLGAYVHGLCADVLKNSFSEYAILPSDCADALLSVYKIIEESDMD